MALHRNWPNLDATRSLRPWLFGVAFRVVRTHRRRRAREAPHADLDPEDGAPTPEAWLQGQESLALLSEAFEHVPVSRRSVVVKHDLDGLDVIEIARELSLTKFGVYARLYKGRKELAAAVRPVAEGRAVEMKRRGSDLEPELEALLTPREIQRQVPPELRARALARARATLAGDVILPVPPVHVRPARGRFVAACFRSRSRRRSRSPAPRWERWRRSTVERLERRRSRRTTHRRPERSRHACRQPTTSRPRPPSANPPDRLTRRIPPERRSVHGRAGSRSARACRVHPTRFFGRADARRGARAPVSQRGSRRAARGVARAVAAGRGTRGGSASRRGRVRRPVSTQRAVDPGRGRVGIAAAVIVPRPRPITCAGAVLLSWVALSGGDARAAPLTVRLEYAAGPGCPTPPISRRR